jgi:hypothetical protein
MTTKITELTSGTPALADIVPYVSDPGGTAITKKSTVSSLLSTTGLITVPLINSIPHKQLLVLGAKPTITSGCGASTQIEMGTNKNVYDYLPFDKDTVEYAYINVVLPQDFKPSATDIYAQFYWTHPSTTTNFKVSWGIKGVCIANDETLDVVEGTAVYSNDEGGTTSDLYISPLSAAITLAGTPAAGELCHLKFKRQADDATNDTLAVDAYFIGVLLWYPVA